MIKAGYWLVVALFGITAVIGIGQGIALMAGWTQPNAEQLAMAGNLPDKQAFILGMGIGTAVGGLLALLVAWGLFGWRRWGRILAIILCILNLLGVVIASFKTRLGVGEMIAVVLVVVALFWLFHPEVKATFAAGGKPA